jgi:hypothetical protein
MFTDIKVKADNIWLNHKKCVIGGVIVFVLGALIF